MTTSTIPDGMIPVEDFSKKKGLKPEKAIKMIRDGIYVGQIVGDQWFVSASELTGSNWQQASHTGLMAKENYPIKNRSIKEFSQYYLDALKNNLEGFSKFFSFISVLFLIQVSASALAALNHYVASRFYGGIPTNSPFG